MKGTVPVGQIHAFMSLPQRTDGNIEHTVLFFLSQSGKTQPNSPNSTRKDLD